MKTFGLIGYPLGHSFSKSFFAKKFEEEGIKDCEYRNFEIDDITKFPEILKNNPDILGLNVTIPYKQQVMEYLDEIDGEAQKVGAVNTVKPVVENGDLKLIGFNTDIYGFETSLVEVLGEEHKKALILGTGGASKAIKYVLDKLKIEFLSASIEELQENEIEYSQIDEQMIKDRKVIINATPLGTYPKVDACPPIPYEYITNKHVLFDLVYNPDVTLFMEKGKERGAVVKNGLEMLHLQAIKAWEIWNRKSR